MKISLDDLVYAIPKAWSEETRGNDKSPRSTSTHIAAGQCIVSSLLVQRHHGGDIVKCVVGRTYNTVVHYLNDINGVMIDLTRAQFKSVSPYSQFKKNPDPKTYIFNGDANVLGTVERVNILEDRVLEVLSWR